MTAVIRRAMVSMFDAGDVAPVAEIVDASYFDHQDTIRGPGGFEQVVTGARSSCEALHVIVEDLIETDDRVTVRLRSGPGVATDGNGRSGTLFVSVGSGRFGRS